MDKYNDNESGVTILPGVDLALWLRILVTLLLLVVAGGVVLAVAE
jgi:hypothetical protein